MGVSVLFDNEWLDEYEIERVMVNGLDKEIGLVVGSKNVDDKILLEIYRLNYDYKEKSYSLGSIVTSVTCDDEEDKEDFLNLLPEMINIFNLDQVHN